MLRQVQESGADRRLPFKGCIIPITFDTLPMFKIHYMISVLCPLVLLGCESVTGEAGNDSSTKHGAIAPEISDSVPVSIAQSGKRADVSAQGGAHFTVPPEVFGDEVGNVLTFNARKVDGAVSGHYNYHQTFQGETFKFNGPVTCFNVYDGNRAKVGALVELSNDATLPPGVFIWWSVIDHGEGAGAPPDESTIIGAGDEAANEAFCNSPDVPRFGPWEIDGGTFQVDG